MALFRKVGYAGSSRSTPLTADNIAVNLGRARHCFEILDRQTVRHESSIMAKYYSRDFGRYESRGKGMTATNHPNLGRLVYFKFTDPHTDTRRIQAEVTLSRTLLAPVRKVLIANAKREYLRSKGSFRHTKPIQGVSSLANQFLSELTPPEFMSLLRGHFRGTPIDKRFRLFLLGKLWSGCRAMDHLVKALKGKPQDQVRLMNRYGAADSVRYLLQVQPTMPAEVAVAAAIAAAVPLPKNLHLIETDKALGIARIWMTGPKKSVTETDDQKPSALNFRRYSAWL